jgi:predicted esterase
VLVNLSLRAEEGNLSLSIGETNILQIATLSHEAEKLSQSGVGQPEIVVVGLALPPGFDPSRPTPIVFTSVTGDPYQSNIKEMEVYRETALARGWVVLTGQPHPWTDRSRDTVVGRSAAAEAALRALAEIVPQSKTWPIAFAGFSGGSKMSQLLAGYFISRNRQVIGLYLSGCNEASILPLFRSFPEGREALKEIGYYLSSGQLDQISTPWQMDDVKTQLRRKGARHVKLKKFDGPHANYLPHLDEALAWFEELYAARDK